MSTQNPIEDLSSNSLYGKIRDLIEQAREQVISHVNQSITLLNWSIGELIHEEILQDSRASYGKEILATLSQQLTVEYGRGYNYSALTRMLKFYRKFPEGSICRIDYDRKRVGKGVLHSDGHS